MALTRDRVTGCLVARTTACTPAATAVSALGAEGRTVVTIVTRVASATACKEEDVIHGLRNILKRHRIVAKINTHTHTYILAKPITKLFNIFIPFCNALPQWRSSTITPVEKVSCPISVTSILWRLLERIVVHRLFHPFLTKSHTNEQYSICLPSTQTHFIMHTSIHTYKYTYIQVYIHTSIHTYKYTYIHAN